MSEVLTNKQTSSVIDESSIITKTENGVVYSDKNCWNYVPNQNIDKSDDTIYYEKESVPEYDIGQRQEPYFTDKDIDQYYTEKAQYVFGFDFYGPNKRYTNTNVSAVASKEINLGNFSYITIETEEDADDNSVIEYAVISGNQQIPVIPENHSRRVKEKLFYQHDTRFIIDHSSDAPTYYEDGIKIEALPQDSKNWEEHNYFIEYTAGSDPYKIVPPNSKIRLVVYIRNSGSVKNITIKKYGGELKWN